MGEDPVMIVYLLSMDGSALAKVLAERFGWMVVSPDDSVKSAADEGVNKTAWDLGNMLMDGKAYIEDAPWLSLFPGLAILVTVLGYNLLGESLRDLLDPRLRR